MRLRKAWRALALAALLAGPAAAQTQPNYGQTASSGSAFQLQTEAYLFGQTLATANLTGCVGGSPTLVGSLWGAKVTAGTNTSTTCTITWPVARSVAPNCVLQLDSAGPTLPVITVETTTTLTWTWTTTTASTVWDVICVGPR